MARLDVVYHKIILKKKNYSFRAGLAKLSFKLEELIFYSHIMQNMQFTIHLLYSHSIDSKINL